MAKAQLEGYLTSAEAAKVLGVVQRRVSQLCAQYARGDSSGLKSIRVANRWFVESAAVYARLAERG